MKALYPDAAILVHPESPESVIELADAVGSTSQLIAAAQNLPNKTFIVDRSRHFLQNAAAVPGQGIYRGPDCG